MQISWRKVVFFFIILLFSRLRMSLCYKLWEEGRFVVSRERFNSDLQSLSEMWAEKRVRSNYQDWCNFATRVSSPGLKNHHLPVCPGNIGCAPWLTSDPNRLGKELQPLECEPTRQFLPWAHHCLSVAPLGPCSAVPWTNIISKNCLFEHRRVWWWGIKGAALLSKACLLWFF